MKIHTRQVLIVGILILIAFAIGYMSGVKSTIHWGVMVVDRLMEKQKLNISIDTTMIETAVLQYQEQIGGCLFIQDAPLFNNTRM